MTRRAIALILCLLAAVNTVFGQLLYEADDGVGNINQITPSGTVTQFSNVIGMSARGIEFDTSGNLYTASINGTVSIVAPDGSVSTLASGLHIAEGLAIDSSGNVYVSIRNGGVNDWIDKITPGGVVTTFASGFNNPGGLVFDSSGNLFLADSGNGVIDKITPSGVVSFFATAGGYGLTIDSNGNLFLATGGVSVDEITSAGVVSTFATGMTDTNFLAFDSSGNLFVSDDSGEIYKVTSGGIVSPFVAVPEPFGLAFRPAPEPGTIALLLSGLGWIGLAVRRKRVSIFLTKPLSLANQHDATVLAVKGLRCAPMNARRALDTSGRPHRTHVLG